MEFAKRRKAVEKAFGRTSLSADGINCAVKCPSCNEKKKNKLKLIIRLDDGRYQCWVCGIKGANVSYLASKYGKLNEDLSNTFGKKVKKIEGIERTLELPKSSTFLLNKSCDPDQAAVLRYVKRRGLSNLDVYRWRMLYSSNRSHRRRVIIPSFDADGNLNYYVARSIDSNRIPRYMNSKVSKNDIIFNEIDIDWSKQIVLVEGVFDAMKCGNNVIPILGSTLSKKSELYMKLIRGACKVTLSLDPDLKDKSYVIADNLARDGCEVSISFAPKDRDLGEMCKRDAREVISNQVAYDPMSALMSKIQGIKSGSIF